MKKRVVKKFLALGIMLCCTGFNTGIEGAYIGSNVIEAAPANEIQPIKPVQMVKKVRLSWQTVPNAVFYEVVILNGSDALNSRVMMRRDSIAVNGVELNMRFNTERDKLYWRVRALNAKRQPMSEYTIPAPLKEQELNPRSIKTTVEYDELKYMKAYPVYSWIPASGAESYALQVYKDIDFKRNTTDKLLKSVRVEGGNEYDYYDFDSYVQPGLYWWRVCGLKKDGQMATEWSEREYFLVRSGAKLAALGDSITHGGGAISVPPSNISYDWEIYTGKDIKNLGFSGNTVEAMLARFDNDVLSDKPKILIIMGGINNIRCGDKAEIVINGLNALKYKCLSNGIKPVFVTIAPINPAKMKLISGLDTAATWKAEQLKINNWIKEQQYNLDITKPLSDRRGWLKDELSSDGLHPDMDGKKIIGMAIGNYIEETFDL